MNAPHSRLQPEIQGEAVKALRAFSGEYLNPCEVAESSKQTVEFYSTELVRNPNAAAQRGYALALGALPARIVARTPDSLAAAISALNTATLVQENADQRDADTRRNAVQAIAELAATVGISMAKGIVDAEAVDTVSLALISPQQFRSMFDAVLAAAADYCTDDRGDVGSWVRRAALKALVDLVFQLLRSSEGEQAGSSAASFELPSADERMKYLVPIAFGDIIECIESEQPLDSTGSYSMSERILTPDMVRDVTAVLLKQLSEKIIAIRECAGEQLTRLLHSSKPVIPFLADRQLLQKVFPLKRCTIVTIESQNTAVAEFDVKEGCMPINWASPSDTFPILVQVLASNHYRQAVTAGLVISVGGLTESLVKQSSASLLGWCKDMLKVSVFVVRNTPLLLSRQLKNRRVLAEVARCLLEVFENNPKDKRVILPLFKVLIGACTDDSSFFCTVFMTLSNLPERIYVFFNPVDPGLTFGEWSICSHIPRCSQGISRIHEERTTRM